MAITSIAPKRNRFMDIDTLRTTLLAQPGAAEDFPFGPDPLVLKVGGKMFALVALNQQPLRISLKCDPTHAELLRDQYPAIEPGYYLNKRHWNTITLDGSVPHDEILALIDESYRLVVKGLPKDMRENLK